MNDQTERAVLTRSYIYQSCHFVPFNCQECLGITGSSDGCQAERSLGLHHAVQALLWEAYLFHALVGYIQGHYL